MRYRLRHNDFDNPARGVSFPSLQNTEFGSNNLEECPFFAQSATKCAQKRRKACIDSWLKFAYLRIPVFYCIGSYKKFMRSYGIFARRQAPFQQPVAQKADEPSSLLNKATLHGGTK